MPPCYLEASALSMYITSFRSHCAVVVVAPRTPKRRHQPEHSHIQTRSRSSRIAYIKILRPFPDIIISPFAVTSNACQSCLLQPGGVPRKRADQGPYGREGAVSPLSAFLTSRNQSSFSQIPKIQLRSLSILRFPSLPFFLRKTHIRGPGFWSLLNSRAIA